MTTKTADFHEGDLVRIHDDARLLRVRGHTGRVVGTTPLYVYVLTDLGERILAPEELDLLTVCPVCHGVLDPSEPHATFATAYATYLTARAATPEETLK